METHSIPDGKSVEKEADEKALKLKVND